MVSETININIGGKKKHITRKKSMKSMKYIYKIEIYFY
jgi:hypothetical protein